MNNTTKIIMLMIIMILSFGIVTAVECDSSLSVMPCDVTAELFINAGTYNDINISIQNGNNVFCLNDCHFINGVIYVSGDGVIFHTSGTGDITNINFEYTGTNFVLTTFSQFSFTMNNDAFNYFTLYYADINVGGHAELVSNDDDTYFSYGTDLILYTNHPDAWAYYSNKFDNGPIRFIDGISNNVVQVLLNGVPQTAGTTYDVQVNTGNLFQIFTYASGNWSINSCTPSWVCNNETACLPGGYTNCTGVYDTNMCGISYTGDYSEFNPVSTCSNDITGQVTQEVTTGITNVFVAMLITMIVIVFAGALLGYIGIVEKGLLFNVMLVAIVGMALIMLVIAFKMFVLT